MNYTKQFPLLVFLLTATACAAPTGTADPALQGEWKGRFVTKTKVGKNGVRCSAGGTGTLNIQGTEFRGVGRSSDYNVVFYVIGTQVADGLVKGVSRDKDRPGLTTGTFEGKLNGGVLRGIYAGLDGCRGNWTATRVS